jgi:hypothetical protein
MDNATRKELLYKARAVGYPGSILDVFANYDQGRDLIAEFQQQQQMQQAQQMSNIAAQQSGLEQPQQQMQQPQQQMQPQMPVVPSSPTPAPNFTPPQPPAPIGVQSQDSPMGMVSGQSGPNQGRAIFASGGFTTDPPSYTLPTLEIKATRNAPVPKMLEPGFQDELAYQEAKNKLELRQQLESGQLRNKDNPGIFEFLKNGRQGEEALKEMYRKYPDDKRLVAKEDRANKETGEFLIKQGFQQIIKAPRFLKRAYDIFNLPDQLEEWSQAEREAKKEYGNYTDELQNQVDTYEKAHGTYKPSFIERMRKTRFKFATGGFTEEDPIKDAYAAYNANKLAQITDPRTGKLLPTNDPRAQIDLRETMWKRQPTKENRTEGTIDERRQTLSYPTNMGENDLFFNRSEGVGDLPMRAVKIGAKGLLEEEYILGPKGNLIKNPNYTGKLSEEGKEWAEKAVSKYGLDPAVIGYFNQSAMSDSTKTLADYDPSILLPSEKYSKQPIISVGEIGNQLTWAPRKGDIMTKKNVADEEGQPRVVGATNMSGVDIPKKKKEKKLGGVKCYTCVGRKRRV